MRNQPTDDQMIGLVIMGLNEAIDNGKPFSIYELTQAIRSAHPSQEVSHRVVRKIVYPVLKSMLDNQVMTVEDKGAYNEYTPLTYS